MLALISLVSFVREYLRFLSNLSRQALSLMRRVALVSHWRIRKDTPFLECLPQKKYRGIERAISSGSSYDAGRQEVRVIEG